LSISRPRSLAGDNGSLKVCKLHIVRCPLYTSIGITGIHTLCPCSCYQNLHSRVPIANQSALYINRYEKASDTNSKKVYFHVYMHSTNPF
jgi:hypothetical protein